MIGAWHDVRLLNTLANALMACAVIAFVVGVLGWLIQRPMFTLHTVQIESTEPGNGLRHMTIPGLRSSPAMQWKGNFFTVDLNAVRSAFESVPWVRRAEVRRVWPNTLRVAIEEHRPLAVWSDGRLVNTQGELFAANVAEAALDAELLEFSGPAGTEASVTRRWQELRAWLAPLQLEPRAVSLSTRYAWSARLDNGMTLLLGREQGMPIGDRVNRWVQAHPAASARLTRDIVAVDLRYPNGFAVHAPGATARPGRSAGVQTAQGRQVQ